MRERADTTTTELSADEVSSSRAGIRHRLRWAYAGLVFMLPSLVVCAVLAWFAIAPVEVTGIDVAARDGIRHFMLGIGVAVWWGALGKFFDRKMHDQ